MGKRTIHKGSSQRVTRTVLVPALGPSSSEIKLAERRKFTRTKLAEQTAHNEERVRNIFRGIDPETVALVREQALRLQNRTADGVGAEPHDVEMEWVDEVPVEDDFIQAMKDIQRLPHKPGAKKKSTAWQERKAREAAAWAPLFEDLTTKFMHWRHCSRAVDNTSPEPSVSSPESTEPQANAVPDVATGDTHYFITVATLDIFTRVAEVTVTLSPAHASPAIDLMAQGWVAKTPERPSIAVSVSTLDLLHRLRQRKPSFSIEAFTKVVCDYYMIPFRSYLRRVLADTYDIYLCLRRRERKQIWRVLKWDTPDWRPLNACRACCYTLKDEPPMKYSRLIAMDGNNSLKRMALTNDRVAGDTRVLDDSTYFLPSEYVNRFANEVRGRRSVGPAVKGRRTIGDSDDEDETDDDTDQVVEGDPTDGLFLTPATHHASTPGTNGESAAGPSEPPLNSPEDALQAKLLSQCVKNWKAASSEDKKKMWSIFDESGVFVSACRHGFILWVIDMIRSGELAKYPLATIAKILEAFAGAIIGYDIGCSFNATVLYSSLAQAFKDKNCHLCVNAFHGYTHSHVCQLRYHPNNVPGTGIEDLETLERVFSSSNQLASVIRYASPFRRRLFIEAHYEQWDDDKYHNLGTFLLGNYVQALKIIHEDGATLEASKVHLQLSDELMDQWSAEEREFFATLGEEWEYDVHAVAYVELLQQLQDLEARRSNTNSRFVAYTPNPDAAAYEKDTSSTRRLESERRHARQEHARVNLEVCELEIKLGITNRWTPVTPEYIAAYQYLRERKYRRALEKLQRLVIQRLFELHKLNVAQTGYKLRMHISKSLQVRCKTIRKAVTAYNSAAAALDPPRPALDWSAISHYGFLEEFSLLQDTRNDIRDKRWTKPEVRATLKLRNRVERAREEIVRLNVEVRRLHTAILDEDELFERTLTGLDSSSAIHGALLDFATRRRNVNDTLLSRIEDIYSLPGFTGVREPGEAMVSMNAHLPVPIEPTRTPLDARVPINSRCTEDGSDGEDSGDEDEQTQHRNVVEFVSELALS